MFEDDFVFYYIRFNSKQLDRLNKIIEKLGKNKTKLLIIILGLLVSFVVNLFLFKITKVEITETNAAIIMSFVIITFWNIIKKYINMINRTYKNVPEYNIEIDN